MIELLTTVQQDYYFLGIMFFILLRALAIIIPPFLGFAIDIAGIAIFGWFEGFIYAEVGIMIGAVCAFGITRKSRGYFASKLRLNSQIESWIRKIDNKDSIWAWTALRLATNPVFDLISYAAGFTKISLRTFSVATFLGNIPSIFLFYYLGGKGMEFAQARLYVIMGSVSLIIIYAIYFLGARYRLSRKKLI